MSYTSAYTKQEEGFYHASYGRAGTTEQMCEMKGFMIPVHDHRPCRYGDKCFSKHPWIGENEDQDRVHKNPKEKKASVHWHTVGE
jgi:hypothetical protein